MKILLSHFSLYKKNGWGRTFEEAKGLARLGHDVTLLCSVRGIGCIYKSSVVEGVRVLAFYDIIPERFLRYGYGFFSLFNKLIYSVFTPFDICLSNSHRDNAYYPCAINRVFHHSKLVIEWWDDFSEKNKRLVASNSRMRLQMERNEKREIETKLVSDFVIVLSSLMARRAEKIGIYPDKIRIVRGGCDVDHIAYIPQSNVSIKENLGLPQNCITFGFIGDGDSEMADIGVFLDAMLELKSKYNLRFLNYGRAMNKAVNERVELKEIVHECGWVDYYGDNSILSATDVFVLIKQDNTENQSGWPNKFGDYLACGRPVIVNPYGEIIPFIQEWKPGIIKVEYSKESIMDGITAICEGKVDMVGFGKQNHDIACLNSWLHKAKELEEVFKSLK